MSDDQPSSLKIDIIFTDLINSDDKLSPTLSNKSNQLLAPPSTRNRPSSLDGTINDSKTAKKKPDNLRPYVIVSRPGSVELRLNQSMMEKLENSSFTLAPNGALDKDLDAKLYSKNAKFKKSTAQLSRVPIQQVTPDEPHFTVVEKRPPTLSQASRRNGFLLDNHLHPDTLKKMATNVSGSRLYSTYMKSAVDALTSAQGRLTAIKTNKHWSISNLFLEPQETKPIGKIESKAFVNLDPGLELDSVTMRENALENELQKRKLDHYYYERDIQGLREEICAFSIHREQVFLIKQRHKFH